MRKRIWRTVIIVFVLLLALAVAAIAFPQKFLCVDSGPTQADVMVVLGGGSSERPERAAELFKEHAAPRIIVSGWGDCEINRQLLIEDGVPADVIGLETRSRTTRENAELTVKLLREQKPGRVILVTSWYHSRRALASFRHYAPEIKFYSRPSYVDYARADWPGRRFARRVYLEYLKLFGYWIGYGVRPF
ncbi:MAG: YdcF family protein [Verrucomicrobiota bacterium]